LGELSFGERFFQTLSKNLNYGKLIEKVILPSDSTLTKAKISSTLGYVVGKTIGLGWRSKAVVTILFKDCPIDRAIIVKEESGSKVCFYFPTVASRDDLNKECFIEPKTKGVFRKEIIGAHIAPQKHLRNCPGSEEIEKDATLMNEFFNLFKAKKFLDVRGFAKIIIQIKYLFDQICRFGEIQVNLKSFYEDEEQLQNYVITKLFDCSLRIATHIQNRTEKDFLNIYNEKVLEREKRHLERRRLGLNLPQCKEFGCEALPKRFMKTKDGRLVGLCELHFEKMKLLTEEKRLEKLKLLAERQKKKKERRPL